MPIKTFKLNENVDIDKIINDWAEKNNIKIDNTSCCQLHLYKNSTGNVSESDLLIIVNYHKKRNRTKKL